MAIPQPLSLCVRVRCFGCRSDGALLCEECASELRPPSRAEPVAFADRVVASWAYEGAARDLILALKLRHRRDAAIPLADAVAAAVRAGGTPAQVVTWVPGRRRDVRVRGFDHAEVIARRVAGRLGLPLQGLLRRTSTRPDQTTLSGLERRTNLVGAFSARSCPPAVLLVDDLVTTGATASACGGALRRAGARWVEAVAPCRA